jgi:hypothetical protein
MLLKKLVVDLAAFIELRLLLVRELVALWWLPKKLIAMLTAAVRVTSCGGCCES